MAMTIVRRPWPRLTASSSAMRIVGKVRVASTMRMRTLSSRPPAYPERMPMASPMPPPARRAAAATVRLTRAP